VRISNLCSRLLTLPVLTQKWAILYFLHQVTEPDSSRSGAPDWILGHAQRNGNGEAGVIEEGATDPAFNDAFAPGGLSILPTHESRPKTGVEDRRNGALRSREKSSTLAEPPDESLKDMAAPKEEPPTEAALLHDLPFTLQGLSTTHLPFSDTSILKLPPTLPLPMISLLHTLAEPSLLYRSLSDSVPSRDEGLVRQSLRAAIDIELRSYLGLIAALEGEIRRALTSMNITGAATGIGKIGVTLKRCVIWTREATMGLRLMSIMVEEAQSKSVSTIPVFGN